MADEWSALLPSAGVRDPFHTFVWYRSWLRVFGAEASPRLLVARVEGQLAGLLPLVRSRVSRRPWLALHHLQVGDLQFIARRHRYWNIVPSWQLSGPVNLQCMSIRASWLIRRGHERQFWTAIANYLAERTDWDLFILPAVNSEQTETFAEIFRAQGLPVEVRPRAISLFGLRPLPWPEYLKTRTSHFMRRARAIERSVKALGEIEINAVRDRSAIPATLENLFALARRSHKQQPRANQAWFLPLTDETVMFYGELAEAYANRNNCVIHTVSCDGNLIAGLFSLIEGDRLFALLTYFAPEFYKASPGRYLMQVLIDWSGNNGIKWIDYNGNSTWVQMFAKQPTDYDECVVFRARGFSAIQYWLNGFSRRLLSLLKKGSKMRPQND